MRAAALRLYVEHAAFAEVVGGKRLLPLRNGEALSIEQIGRGPDPPLRTSPVRERVHEIAERPLTLANDSEIGPQRFQELGGEQGIARPSQNDGAGDLLAQFSDDLFVAVRVEF